MEQNSRLRAGQQSIGAFGPDSGVVDNESADAAVEVRVCFNGGGGALREDPATGSLNESVAQWLKSTGRMKAPYMASQVAKVGRDGRVQLTEAEGKLWVGGSAVATVVGKVAT